MPYLHQVQYLLHELGGELKSIVAVDVRRTAMVDYEFFHQRLRHCSRFLVWYAAREGKARKMILDSKNILHARLRFGERSDEVEVNPFPRVTSLPRDLHSALIFGYSILFDASIAVGQKNGKISD